MNLLATVTRLAQDSAAAPPPSSPLRAEGWVFMLLSVAFVTLLVGYCYYKVLTTPEQDS